MNSVKQIKRLYTSWNECVRNNPSIIITIVFPMLWLMCAQHTYSIQSFSREGDVSQIRRCLSDTKCRKTKNLLDGTGKSALHIATLKGTIPVIHELLSAGADPNIKDTKGLPPLLYAAKTGNDKVFTELVNGGADINMKIKDGRSILMDLILYGNPESAAIFLDYGADLTIRDDKGRNAVVFACMKGDAIVLQKLLDMLPDARSVTKEKNTPIHYASYKGSDECLRILLDHGFDINATNIHGENALFDACSQKNMNVIRFLLDHGINLYQKNINQQYAYEKLFDEKKAASVDDMQKDILFMLFEHGFVLPDSACDLSVQARASFIAGNYAFSIRNAADGIKHHGISRKAYYEEADLAIQTADSLQKIFNRQEAAKVASNIALTALTGVMTGTSAYSGLLASRVSNSSHYSFTYYTLVPSVSSVSDIQRLIDCIRDYASECKMMASRCRVE